MTWIIIHSVFRLAAMGLAIVAITKYRDMFNMAERIGLSLMGGCAFMTIGIIWEREHSPFDGWASSLFTFGFVLFMSGLLHRKGKHERANAKQRAMGREWQAQKGKP